MVKVLPSGEKPASWAGHFTSSNFTSQTSGPVEILRTGRFPGEPSVLAYANLGGLISLAESAGLGEDPAYATFAQDLRRLEALGVAVESTPEMLSTDARLLVAQPPRPGNWTLTVECADACQYVFGFYLV